MTQIVKGGFQEHPENIYRGIPWNKGKKGLQMAWNKGLKGVQVAWNKGKSNTWAIGDKNVNWKGGVSKTKEYIGFKRRQREYRKRNAIGSHTLQEWEALKKYYKYMCLCCKQFEPEIILTEDHIIPLSKGGSNFIDNIQPLSNGCNARKGIKTINYLFEKSFNLIH